MGRGRGSADDIFYGDTLASVVEAPAKSQEFLDMQMLDDMTREVAIRLIALKRNPQTLQPTDSGERLLASGRSFQLWSGLDFSADDGKWISIEFIYDHIERDAKLCVVCCDPVSQSDTRVGPILYSGRSSKDALEAAKNWAIESGSEEFFPLSDQMFFDIIQSLQSKMG